MKRKLFNSSSLKHTALAVPAAALMLGAAHAGTTVGLNFQSWYYDSGTTPQTIGFGQGYQTTGWPVTAKAFGVPVANWTNTDPMDSSSPVSFTLAFAGVTGNFNTVNMWQSDIGNLVNPADEWTPPGPTNPSRSSVLPGNDEVTWSFEDNTGWTNSLSGLHTAFPNGYVIELIGATKCLPTSQIVVSDGVTTTTNGFNVIYTAGNANYNGPVGLLALTNYTSDSLTFGAASRGTTAAQLALSCALAGFIITDQPVVTRDPANVTVNQGSTLTLSARAVGIATLAYQWQHNGTNYPGATTLPFSKTATPADTGNWVLVVTNSAGSAISSAAAVTINQVPLITTDLAATTNTVYTGTPVTLSVVAGGASPLIYQWKRNGANIAGATNSSLALSNLTAGLFGYSVTVSNQYSPPIARSSTNYLNVVAAPDAYTAMVASDGPYSYWPFGETTGVTAFDYSGFGHNAAISNSVTLGAAGPQPPTFPGFSAGTKAYQFDGTTAFVDAGTTASLDGTNDFTVEAWVNSTSATTQIIAEQRDSAGFTGEYKLTLNSDGTLNFFIYNGGYQANITSSGSIANGAWHHVVAVRAGVNLYIYVDGGLAASGAGTSALALVGTLRTYIGSDQRDHVAYFNGSMAEVAIYTKALTTKQVINHYRTGSGASFTVKMTPGGMIEDSKPAGILHPGAGHNIGWSNSVTDVAAVPVTRTGVGLFATASGSQIVTPYSSDFDSTTGTIMFWLKATAPVPGPGLEGAILFDRRTTNGTVIVLNDAGAIFVQCAGNANSFSAGYVPDDNWHHVAVTYDQSATGSIEIFMDGVSQGSQLNTTNWAWPTAQQIEIGKSHDPYWKRYDGKMDDFRIYSRILTQAEIATVQSSDALVDTAALKLRYNFGTAAGVGQSVSWSFGTLMSSPTLGQTANWQPVPGAISPYSFMPTGPALFFRAQY
jgi:hypothetical protein